MTKCPALLAVLLAATFITAPAMAQATDQPASAGLGYSQALGQAAIRSVQDRLKASGAFAGAADGNWAADSAAALQGFQQSHGLPVTGEINLATAAALGLDPAGLVGSAPAPAPAAAAATPVAPPPPVAAAAPAAQPAAPPVAAAPPVTSPPPVAAAPSTRVFALSSDSVRIIQARLRQLGLYNGGVDGLWGSGSLAALQAFQQSHGLPADGRLTSASVAALGIDPATMQPN